MANRLKALFVAGRRLSAKAAVAVSAGFSTVFAHAQTAGIDTKAVEATMSGTTTTIWSTGNILIGVVAAVVAVTIVIGMIKRA